MNERPVSFGSPEKKITRRMHVLSGNLKDIGGVLGASYSKKLRAPLRHEPDQTAETVQQYQPLTLAS